MPKVKNAPEHMKEIMESAYNSCKKRGMSSTRCSKIAWGAAKNAGYYRDTNHKWHKRGE